ncbi:MAG: hypothetical protein JNK46_14650 [Methylobacteriaceae bacterium]|nr:hypothetical protein [Methylobacteriaceae bacterium]
MAHFELNRTRVSQKRLPAVRGTPFVYDLWGPFDRNGDEVTVQLRPAVAGAVNRKLKLDDNRQRYELISSGAARIRLEAMAGADEWDWFDVDVATKSWALFLDTDKQAFCWKMAEASVKAAKDNDIPLSGLLACAMSESKWGTSDIFKQTGCPFNLQKPVDWLYPKCKTMALKTKNKAGSDAVAPATFCVAESLEDAARLFCEWVLHFGESAKPPRTTGRDLLLKSRSKPKEFAESLYLVGFADSKKELTKEFGVVWESFGLGRFDP